MEQKIIFPNKHKDSVFLIEDRNYIYYFLNITHSVRFYKAKRRGNLATAPILISVREILEKFRLTYK